jgi:hypothetical protein
LRQHRSDMLTAGMIVSINRRKIRACCKTSRAIRVAMAVRTSREGRPAAPRYNISGEFHALLEMRLGKSEGNEILRSVTRAALADQSQIPFPESAGTQVLRAMHRCAPSRRRQTGTVENIAREVGV